MASPFKIPKKKQPSGSDSIRMQSPLSRLQSSTSDHKSSYGAQSSSGGADRTHAGNTLGSPTNRQSGPCRPIFRDVVKNLLVLNSPYGGASAANHRATGGSFSQSAPGQRAESSSPCFSNGWRPKRASDRLLQPAETSEHPSPPQKKNSDLSGVSLPTKRISVESLDSLAELRGVKHSGSSSARRDAAEWKNDIGNSSSLINQQKTILSLSGSDQTSEDESVCLTGIRTNPSADKSPKRRPSLFPVAVSPKSSSTTADTRRSLNRGAERLASSGSRREDPREEERRRWMEFREKTKTTRSAVLGLQLKKAKPTPAEPIVLSSEEEEEGEDEDDGGKRLLQSSGRLEDSCLGDSGKMQDQQACSSKGGIDECKSPPPSFLQLEFTSLHAGLMRLDANGEMMITDHAITIPVKVPAGGEEGDVTVVASQVKGYGVWDGGVAQDGTLLADCKGPAPSLLFLWVSDAQANLLQMELAALQTPPTSSGPACCCLLLVLKEQLQELPAALLASVLDMEEYRKGRPSSRKPTSPLDWTDGLLLLHSCPPPLDQHLLRLLGCSAEKPRNGKSSQKSAALRQPPIRLIQYPLAPSKGRITVTKEDLACLDDGEFLNDVIIDFYLKYLFLEGVGGSVPERSHVFSSFFYKQLSRRRAAADSDAPSVTDRHMRHQRVKTWTRHVDIFTKDFLFVPVNQEAHWFLVVVCFPGLEDVQNVKLQSGSGASEQTAGKPSVRQQLPDCLQQTCRRDTVLKRPCILVMDSLKLSYHENVCRFLRDYLQVEWEVRRGTPRLFTSDSMRSSNCRVPQQDNSSDCGLYLLQYAESFLQNPVVHFDLPVRLENWFPRQRVRQKREEIVSLIMKMHRSQNEET